MDPFEIVRCDYYHARLTAATCVQRYLLAQQPPPPFDAHHPRSVVDRDGCVHCPTGAQCARQLEGHIEPPAPPRRRRWPPDKKPAARQP